MCDVGLSCHVLSLGGRDSGTAVGPTYVFVAFLVWFCLDMDEEDKKIARLWQMMSPPLLELVVASLFVVGGKLY